MIAPTTKARTTRITIHGAYANDMVMNVILTSIYQTERNVILKITVSLRVLWRIKPRHRKCGRRALSEYCTFIPSL